MERKMALAEVRSFTKMQSMTHRIRKSSNCYEFAVSKVLVSYKNNNNNNNNNNNTHKLALLRRACAPKSGAQAHRSLRSLARKRTET